MSKKQFGFTLLELVIVIIIIGIVFLASAKGKGGQMGEKLYLSATTKEIIAMIKTAQTCSIQYQTHYKVVFPTGHTFYTYKEDPSNNIWVLPEKGTSNISNKITITSTTLPYNQIIFDKKGVPYEDPASDLPSQINQPLTQERQIYLRHSQLESASTINISPETGYSYE